MRASVINVRGIRKCYGDICAVDGIDLDIDAGEIYGLIGHNGAGKSTLMRIMLGLIRPDAGAVQIMGREVLGEGFRDVRRSVGYLPENVIFYDNLSGIETMRFYAGLKGADPRSCLPLLEKVGLGAARSRPVRGYSRGMRQRLGFAQALLGNPSLLFLDEPTAGLDPGGIRDFYGILEELKEQGVTVLLSSHNLAELQDRLDRLAMIRLGRVQAAGSVSSLSEKLTLPVQVEFRSAPNTLATVRAAMAVFSDCPLSCDGDGGTLACPRARKMEILNALLSVPGVIDIHVREPTLEDVYLGYAENILAGDDHAPH